jgi:tripartite ATP-independent transporter DctM subunit
MIVSTLVLLVTLLIGVPVAFSIGLSALAYFLVADANLLVLPQQFIGQLSNQPLIAIPFFVLAGELMNVGGVTTRIFAFALAVLGRIPGGLGHTNVLAAMIFAGMSGSAVADLASVGKIGLKAMRDNDYPDNISVGVITSASTIGPIIPPSINMVIFGSIANVPIGLLFLGGVLPGILTGVMLMITFAWLFRRRGIKVRVPPPVPFWRTAVEAFWSLMTPVVLLGAMFTGVATPTEAAILAVVYTLIVSALIHRELTLADFFDALLNTAIVSGAILVIIGFAAPLAYVIAREQVALELSAFMVGSFEEQGLLLMFAVAALLLIVGCFMEVVAALILLTPVLGSALIAAKLDPVFIGVMMVYTLGIGLVTPPVGLCLYVGSQISGMRLERVVTATAPFIIPLVVTLLLMILFPPIITFIPNAVYGK